MQRLVNTFEKGCQLGVHPWVQKNDTASYLKNMRLLSREGTSLVLQSMPSTDILEVLPEGSIVAASAHFNGITYFLLRYENREGEVGCYPSPNYAGVPQRIKGKDYQHTELLPLYRAFRNLKRNIHNYYSEFTTPKLTLSETEVVQLEVQPDYDGTVNLIFTDNTAPLRIINSRFSVLPGNRFEIIDRQGETDTNLYDENELPESIYLFRKTVAVLSTSLLSVETGGEVKAGNYIYYFLYEDADGNATDVAAQSELVSVFPGDSFGTIRGGKENEPTEKQVKIRLNGVDRAYPYLRIYFAYTAGDTLSQTTLFALPLVPVSATSMVFTHTGTEEVIQKDISTIQRSYVAIDTVKSICQLGGYLLGANIREKALNTTLLKNFAQKLYLSSGREYMPMQSVVLSDTDFKAGFYTEKLSASYFSGNFYNMGYANPLNIAKRLGYQDGESYAFGMVYIFDDGSLSPVFPLTGVDNLEDRYRVKTGGYYIVPESENIGLEDLTIPDLGESQVKALQNGFDENTGLNTRGIYRFFRLNTRKGGDAMSPFSGIAIQHLLVNIPKEKPVGTIGCFFVRGKRAEDRIAQGYAVPVMKLLQREGGFYQHDHYLHSNVFRDETHYKVLPMIGGIKESIKTNQGPYIRQLRIKRSFYDLDIIDKKRVSLLIPDAFGQASGLVAELNKRQVTVSMVGYVFALTSSEYDFRNASPDFTGQKTHSLLRTIRIHKLNYQNHLNWNAPANRILVKGNSYYTAAASNLYNDGLFSSASEGFLGFSVFSRKGPLMFMHYIAQHNDYFGLVLENQANTLSASLERLWENTLGLTMSVDAGNLYGSEQLIAYLVDLYPAGGPRLTQALREIYNVETIVYTPISQRMNWEEIERNLDTFRNLKLYGGDSYTGVSFRRTEFTNMEPGARAIDPDSAYFNDDNSNALSGQVLTLVTQNNVNPYLRSTDTTLAAGRKRVMLPVLEGSPQSVSEWRKPVYMAVEPEGYNTGYSSFAAFRPYFSLHQQAPYQASHYFNRVIYLGKHVLSSFRNAFRDWNGLNYEDYDTRYGAITRIIPLGNQLGCVFESGAGFIPFQERTYAGQGATGQVFVQASSLLSPGYLDMKSVLYGSQHLESITATDNAIYGVDARKKKIWRLTSSGLEYFSDFLVHPYLEKFGATYTTQRYRLGKETIIAGVNPFFAEIWFSYITEKGESFTVVFSEKNPQEIVFCGFSDLLAYHYARLGTTLLSLNAQADLHVLWQQDCYEKGFLKLYGITRTARLGFLVNHYPQTEKRFENLKISSNAVYPLRISYAVDGAKTEHTVIPFTGENYLTASARYENAAVWIPIAAVADSTDDPIAAFIRQQTGNYSAQVKPGASMQGRALEVLLEYDSNGPIEILSCEIAVLMNT